VSDRLFIRATHPYGFRSGEWAEVLTTAPAAGGADCFVVRFGDGVTDWWRVADPDDGYEFHRGAEPAQQASTAVEGFGETGQ
jgi:hypothetical protein